MTAENTGRRALPRTVLTLALGLGFVAGPAGVASAALLAPGVVDLEASEPEASVDLCDVDEDAADAEKLVLVQGTGGPDADISTCARQADGSYAEQDTYAGHVGYNGIAAEGKKVAGDGKTPSGTFALEEGFGHKKKPAGFSDTWHVVKKGDVWSGKSSGPERAEYFNTYVKDGYKDGFRGENLWSDSYKPAYNYSWVIDYNRNPGDLDKGAAIFLHVNTGSGRTAGCVSLPEDDLLDVIEWSGSTDTEIQIRR